MTDSIFDEMSRSEKEVADYLTKLKIWWQYEQPLYVYDDKKRPRVWTPDFYLPKLGVYIEVCGSKKFNYEYRQKIYERNNVPIIFIHKYKTPIEWQTHLKNRVIEIHKERTKIIDKL